MIRYAYVNGRFTQHSEASVHIEDRGYQFSDGVYEVAVFYNRTLVDGDLHLDRLLRSLDALNIDHPLSSRAALDAVVQEAIRRNPYRNGYVYIQVSRGIAARDHVYKQGVKPSLVITVSREKRIPVREIEQGTEIFIRPDIRWLRRDIKAVALLPNVLLKNEAAAAGKREIWLTDEQGFITEGAVSNGYIVTHEGTLVTRETANHLLAGITRHRVLELARELGIKIEERAFTPEEATSAAEAFLTSSTSHIVPIVKIEDSIIGNGHPGVVYRKLFEAYVDYIEAETGHRIWL